MSAGSITCGHHAELASGNELAEAFDLFLDGSIVDVLRLVGVSWLAASVGVRERHFECRCCGGEGFWL